MNEVVTEVGSGAIAGGWEYVQLAYGLTWVVLVGYAVSLWVRRPRGA